MRLSPGDILSLAPSGTYNIAGGATAFNGAAVPSGTAARHTIIRGNGATISGGAQGIIATGQEYVDYYDLSFTGQSGVPIAAGNASTPVSNLGFYNVSATVTLTGSPAIDTWKMVNLHDSVFVGCHSQGGDSAYLTVDGFEFWGPCTNITLTNCTADGYNNGPGDDDGHGFEVYGESAAQICDGIHFVNCTATNCRAGFSCEGGPSSNALHTDILCDGCSGSGNIVADYRGAEGATLYRTNSPGTTSGSVVDL